MTKKPWAEIMREHIKDYLEATSNPPIDPGYMLLRGGFGEVRDTSNTISDEECQAFYDEIMEILKTTKPH